MDDQFVTDGLEDNRYLKAFHLVSRFESQITETLEAMCRSVRDTHPSLFEPDASLSTRDYTGSTLRTLRTEVEMIPEDDESNNLALNVALEWVQPSNQPEGRQNVARDTLCYVLYKIKYGSDRVWEAVVDETRADDRWTEIRFGEEKWDSPPKVAPGIGYVPVETGSKIDGGLETLEKHFTDVYAPKLRP